MPGQDSPNDANGVALAVGDTVKLVGVITAMDLFNNRFNDLTVTITHPITGILPVQGATGGDATVPGYRTVITVPAAVLVKGS